MTNDNHSNQTTNIAADTNQTFSLEGTRFMLVRLGPARYKLTNHTGQSIIIAATTILEIAGSAEDFDIIIEDAEQEEQVYSD